MSTLTPAQVAAELQIAHATAVRYMREGTLPAFRVGRHWRVDADALTAFKAPTITADPDRIAPRSARSQKRRAS